MIPDLNVPGVDIDLVLREVAELPGDYAEIGVWRGDMARHIHASMDPGATLWLFDSLEGHAEPGIYDDAKAHPRGRYSNTSLSTILQGMNERTTLVSGFIPGTFQLIDPEVKFRFVRIDVDHYEPTKAAIEFVIPRMVRGGIINFDDWDCSDCPGATKAVNEALGPGRHVYWRND